MSKQISPMEALERAIVVVGGQSELARELNARIPPKENQKPIKQGHIWAWLNRHHRVPPEVAPYIEVITAEKGEAIERERLCPDFPWSVQSAESRAGL